MILSSPFPRHKVIGASLKRCVYLSGASIDILNSGELIWYVKSLKIYQIGLGSFGRHGFEKLVEMHNHLEEVDVELKGVCERDFDRLEEAQKFAEANGIDIETFHSVEEMYDAAEEESGKVMFYGAGPADVHAHHIYESLQRGFFHLAEKPPSMTREQHLREKELSKERDVFYKVDFVERENPVVKKALDLLEGEDIESIKVFRESSIGAQKVLQPVERQGVKGGDILDKMVHEVYVLDFLEAAGMEPELELEEAVSPYFMPKTPGSEKLMSVNGSVLEDISEKTATGRTHAVFQAGDVDVEFYSSWLGVSEEAKSAAERVEDLVEESVIDRSHRGAGDKAFVDEEARFFVVEGTRELAGDMLHGNLYDLDSGQQIEVPDLLHDQLYRVVEKAVLSAVGKDVDHEVTEKEIDIFMNAVFDVKERVVENADGFMDELERANRRLKEMIIEDLKMEEGVTA